MTQKVNFQTVRSKVSLATIKAVTLPVKDAGRGSYWVCEKVTLEWVLNRGSPLSIPATTRQWWTWICILQTPVHEERGFPRGSAIKSLLANAGDVDSVPRLGRPLEKGMANISLFLPRKSYGQGSLEDYSPWGHKRVGHNLVTTTIVRGKSVLWVYTALENSRKGNLLLQLHVTCAFSVKAELLLNMEKVMFELPRGNEWKIGKVSWPSQRNCSPWLEV